MLQHTTKDGLGRGLTINDTHKIVRHDCAEKGLILFRFAF